MFLLVLIHDSPEVGTAVFVAHSQLEQLGCFALPHLLLVAEPHCARCQDP